MHLSNLTIRNFRSFDSCEIIFQKELTVFVGENNGGKSNAIDAVRLLTSPLGGRREIYCEATDVRFQSSDTFFNLDASFEDLSVGQQGRLISAATDATLTKARFGLRFDGRTPGSRPLLWGGKEGNMPEPGCHDMIRHLYLPPLRDAKRSLASGNPTRIMALLNHFLENTTPAKLAKELKRTHEHEVLVKVDGAVAKGLTALTSGVRQQSASLGFASDESLIDIARDLRFRLADHGVDPEDLRYSGHGYANLLFMATIAVELEKVRTADLTLFLVEEPEAHLHPQLQAAVLSFLCDQADQSRKQTPVDHGPAGQLQVIVATHSPNLSAWVSSDRLVVFKSIIATPKTNGIEQPVKPSSVDAAAIEGGFVSDHLGGNNDNDPLAATVTAAVLRRSTRCVALSQMPLDPIDRRKVDRYLDVTKAALLFGGRVLLVEGIAEALLLPVIAKYHTLKDNVEKLRLFRSIVFIPIDGVDFSPYATLLLTSIGGARIADRVVILTDGDKGTGEKENEETSEDAAEKATQGAAESSVSKDAKEELIPGERRKKELYSLAKRLQAEAQFCAISSTYSLETELIEAGNEEIMKKAFLKLRPRSEAKWKSAIILSGDDRAKKIHEIFKKTRKGDFAQILADMIEKGDAFKVPSYIEKAIEEVVAL